MLLPEGTPPELIAALNHAVRDTLDHHDLAAFTMPRNAALAHEAGRCATRAALRGFKAWGGNHER